MALDVLDLQEFVDKLWETQGEPKPDAEGKLPTGPDGQPVARTLDWTTIQDAVKVMVKEKCTIDVLKSEALAIWGAVTKRDKDGKTVLEKKRDAWLGQDPEPLDSPSSPNNSDPRFAED